MCTSDRRWSSGHDWCTLLGTQQQCGIWCKHDPSVTTFRYPGQRRGVKGVHLTRPALEVMSFTRSLWVSDRSHHPLPEKCDSKEEALQIQANF